MSDQKPIVDGFTDVMDLKEWGGKVHDGANGAEHPLEQNTWKRKLGLLGTTNWAVRSPSQHGRAITPTRMRLSLVFHGGCDHAGVSAGTAGQSHLQETAGLAKRSQADLIAACIPHDLLALTCHLHPYSKPRRLG
jgi:hypothetical protein